MELSKINALLSNLDDTDRTKLEFVEKRDVTTHMGDESVYEKLYNVIGEDGLYLKITYSTDSYGEGEYIRSIQFVKPVQKTVTVFETL